MMFGFRSLFSKLGVANSRIQECVGQVADQSCPYGNNDSYHGRCFHSIEVTKNGRIVDVFSKAWVAEDDFYNHHATDQPVDMEHDDGDGSQKGVAYGVPEDDPPSWHALDGRRTNVG